MAFIWVGLALEADTVSYVEAKHDLIRVGRILRKEHGLALKQTAPFSVRVDDVHIQRIEVDKASIIAALKADSLEIGVDINPLRLPQWDQRTGHGVYVDGWIN